MRSERDQIIDGDAELPAPPAMAPGEHRFFDGAHRGEKIRLAAYRAANGYAVQVGETLNKRDRLVREILLAELVPTLLIAVATIGLAWWGVARGLRPLAHMRNELLGRSPRDLRPIPETASPIEISPVVEAFNDLLQQLQDSSTMQQRFLANAAHQLRTPLAGLQMHLELMLRRDLAPKCAPSCSACMARRFAPVASPPSSSPSPRPKACRMTASRWTSWTCWRWPETLRATGRRMAIERKIDLGFALSPARIRGDPLLLPELLDNLIDNALRYTPAGGTVTVGTGVRDGMSYLWVEDTGPGITAEEREKVFERFYRVAGTEGDGSGLGLAIVKEIVDRHGGTVSIGPRDGGGGTGSAFRSPARRAGTPTPPFPLLRRARNDRPVAASKTWAWLMLKAKRNLSPMFGSARPAIFAMISCAPRVKDSRNSAPSGSTVVTVDFDQSRCIGIGGSKRDVLGPNAQHDFRPGMNAISLRGSSGSDAPAARTQGCPAASAAFRPESCSSRGCR